MKKSDRDLGMDCDITRRDFLHDSSLLALGLGILGPAVSPASVKTKSTYYPPTRTGMRGSHKGSFETAHTLVQQGSGWESAEETGEEYDLVVVGGGISGLASAWYYRKLHGPESRILIIENHDDFGGHAKRNEFHQGGQMRLAWGGVFNLEYSEFNDTVNALLEELGVNIKTLLANNDFQYGSQGTAGPAIFFDRETYGQDKLVIDCSLRGSDLDKMADKV
ncbi:MAG: spermidine dehydrogenase, partial [Bacteroidia bacterium]